MKKTVILSLLAVLAVCGAFVSPGLHASTDVPGFKFRSVNIPPSPNTGHIALSADAIDATRSLVISSGWDADKKLTLLQASVVTKTGKITGPTTFYATSDTPHHGVQVVWIDAADTDAPAGGTALVYFLTAPNETQEKIVYLKCAHLNDKGALVGKVFTLATFNSDEPYYFSSHNLNVTVGPESLLVVVSLPMWQNVDNTFGFRKAAAYTLVTSFNGKALGSPQKIALPNGGEYQSNQVYPGVWNGSRWIVPMHHEPTKLLDNGWNKTINKYGNALYVLAATPETEGAVKTKLTKVYEDAQKYSDIRGASFVPASPLEGAAQKPSHLVFGVSLFDANSANPLEHTTSRLLVQAIGKKGSRKGAFKEISVPKWTHRNIGATIDQYWLDEGSMDMSRVALDTAGNPVIALFRGTSLVLKTDQSKVLWDTELGVYRLDIDKLTATATMWESNKLPPGYFTYLYLLGSGAHITAIGEIYNWPDTSIKLFGVK